MNKPQTEKIDLTLRHARLEVSWASAITPEAWHIYQRAMDLFREAGIEFMLGGGFAMATFTGRWRDTKDIDFYLHPANVPKAKDLLTRAGYQDLFPELPYDPNWIYRAVSSGTIVDCIWAMANQRAQVDDQWFARADQVNLRGEDLKVLPLEEFIWCKLYILQRDHCDWTDVFNVLYVSGTYLDWEYLMDRVGEDLPLLRGLISVYGWFSPRARQLPAGLFERLDLPVPPELPENAALSRIRYLDSRAWFAGTMPRGHKLEV